MNSACVFLITGPSHLGNAVVSLISLRRHWQGPVLVYALPESIEIAEKICMDDRIHAIPIECDTEYRGKNSQEILKIALIQKIKQYDLVAYLDADLIIRKPIEPLIQAAADNAVGFAATQFNSWTVREGNITYNRVRKLLGIDGIDEFYVKQALRPASFSYNSGIFSTRPDSPVLPEWGKWTTLCKHVYISGECALHPIAQKYAIKTLPNGVYNCSPMFQAKYLADEDVAIWHFHGDSNTRPQKSPRGVSLWFPEFVAAYQQNVAGMQSWTRKIGNTFLNELMDAHGMM